MKHKKPSVRTPSRVSTRHKARIRSRRPLHKKIILHPLAVFMMLAVGVLLVGCSWSAKADGGTDTTSYTVHGKVPASPLTEPAIITSLQNGQHTTSTPVDVSGTCPSESYVKLYRNAVFAGVSVCTSGQFDILTNFVLGINELQAHDFNITDDEGPLSSPIDVYYDSPPQSTNSEASTAAQTPARQNTAPFIITSQYSYTGYPVLKEISWQITTQGGTAPYGFTVKWGDGKESTYVQSTAGVLEIKHAYNSAGDYVIKIFGTDSEGNNSNLQLVAVVHKSSGLAFFGSTQAPLSAITSSAGQWLWVAWPAYSIFALMAVSFWLGERQELLLLRKSKKHVSHRRA